MQYLLKLLEHSLRVEGETVTVLNESTLRANIGRLARVSALDGGERAAQARYLIRATAQALDVIPASIHDLYLARGRGAFSHAWTTPAFNLRAMSLDCARAAFRSARKVDAAAMIFDPAHMKLDMANMPDCAKTTNHERHTFGGIGGTCSQTPAAGRDRFNQQPI